MPGTLKSFPVKKFIIRCCIWNYAPVISAPTPITMTAASNPYLARLLHQRLPRVCVALTASDPTELVDKAEGLVRDNTFLEFRLDYLSKPLLALPKIKRFTEYYPHVVVIATCRRIASGGKFRGTVASQLEILGKATAAGCQIVDVELQTASHCKPAQLQRLRDKASLILSFHDFRATKKLEETLEKMVHFPADFYKIVTTATTLYDNVVMMKFLERHRDQHSLSASVWASKGSSVVYWAYGRAVYLPLQH